MALAKEIEVEVLDGDPMHELNVKMLKMLIREAALRKLRKEHIPAMKEAA